MTDDAVEKNFSCFQEIQIVAFSLKSHADGILGFHIIYKHSVGVV
jgi:hypothetical protein